VGAALLVAGMFPAYMSTDSLWNGRSDLRDIRWYALYALAVAVLALGAVACILIPATRRLIGSGLS
jgi:hypothetical protein